MPRRVGCAAEVCQPQGSVRHRGSVERLPPGTIAVRSDQSAGRTAIRRHRPLNAPAGSRCFDAKRSGAVRHVGPFLQVQKVRRMSVTPGLHRAHVGVGCRCRPWSSGRPACGTRRIQDQGSEGHAGVWQRVGNRSGAAAWMRPQRLVSPSAGWSHRSCRERMTPSDVGLHP